MFHPCGKERQCSEIKKEASEERFQEVYCGEVTVMV